MKNVIISGYYGFGNIGDEAILYSIIKSIRNLELDVNISVLTSSHNETKQKYNVNVVSRNDIKGIIKAIKNCDVFLSGGGSLFQDATSIRSFMFYIGQIIIALMLKKKVYVYAQGIGPIKKKFNRVMFKYFMNKVDYITVRDEDSYKELKRMKIKVPSAVTADPVFLLRKEFINCNNKNGKKKIGICIREWFDSEKIANTIAKLADNLSNYYDAEIVFIPFYYNTDSKFSKYVAQKMHSEYTIIDTSAMSFDDIMNEMSKTDFILGMRLHSLIFAAICEIPFSGISYDPKIDSFLSRVSKTPVLDVEKITSNNEESAFEKVKQEFEDLEFTKKLSTFEKLAYSNIEYLKDMISK